MDTHGTTAVADADHTVPETGERFEKSELVFFVDEDRTAGQAIGKLLAIVFLISFVLMSGVCTWMLKNTNPSHDPQEGVDHEAVESHH